MSDDQVTALAEREQAGAVALDDVLGTGDLARLSNVQRVGHYLRVCRSLGLNPLSRPLDWIVFKDPDGGEKLTLYANQSCAAQLRRQHHIRVEVVRREVVGELFVCEVKASTPDGREDFASKYVPLTNRYGRLTGQHLGNAMMRAETGAKRRVTLSMVGLSEPPDDLPAWRRVIIDGTGRLIEQPTQEQAYLAEHPAAAKAIGEPTFEDSGIPEDAVLDAVAVSQAATTAELQQPSRRGPRPTFRASEEDVKRWLGAWFAAVKGTSLDDDEARHRYVRQWTASEGWPEGRQTDSLRTALARMTEREAGDFLQHVRALVDDERRANEEALAEHSRGAAQPEADQEAF